MRKTLPVLISVLAIITAGMKQSLEQQPKSGAIYITGGRFRIRGLELVELRASFEPSEQGIAFRRDVPPGRYTLVVTGNERKKLITGIQVSADSISLVPVGEMPRTVGDTLGWTSLTKRFVGKIPLQGPKATASLAGAVFDAVSGEPLEGAVVSLSGFPWWSAKTDKSGAFRVRDLPAGRFSVFADKAYYHREYVLGVRVAADSVSFVDFRLPVSAIPEGPLPRTWQQNMIRDSALKADSSCRRIRR